jgi:hypothetical protein
MSARQVDTNKCTEQSCRLNNLSNRSRKGVFVR